MAILMSVIFFLKRCFYGFITTIVFLAVFDNSLIFPCSHAFGKENSDAKELINKSILNRKKVKSWHVKIHLDFPVAQGEGFIWKSITYYQEEGKIRTDVEFPYLEHQRFKGLNADTYEDRTVWADGMQIHFGTKQFPGKAAPAPEIFNVEFSENDPKYHKAFIDSDVRSIGFYPGGTVQKMELDEVLKLLLLNDCKVIDDVIRNISCKKLTASISGSSNQCSFWFAPEKDYSIIRCSIDCPESGLNDQTDLIVAEWKNSGIWFPIKSSYLRKIKNRVLHQEEAKIEIISLNESLPPETFTFAGLGVSKGQSVYGMPEGKYKWDGEKILRVNGMKRNPEEANNSKRTVPLIISSLLAIFCVALLWRTLSKRN